MTRKLIALIPVILVAAAAIQAQDPNLAKLTEHEYYELATPIVRSWCEISAESPAYVFDDMAGRKGWLERALIQRVTVQTGKWNIWIEKGYSVFVIFPYLAEVKSTPHITLGVVFKVKGDLTTAGLVKEIRDRNPDVTIDEFDVFSVGSRVIKRSRPH